MIYLIHFAVFVGSPIIAVLGFTMFRYPKMWAKLNATPSNHTFDSPKQLTHTKRVGILMMVSALFSLLSMLSLIGMMQHFK